VTLVPSTIPWSASPPRWLHRAEDNCPTRPLVGNRHGYAAMPRMYGDLSRLADPVLSHDVDLYFSGSSDLKTSTANQTGSTIIPQRREMSSHSHTRRDGTGIHWVQGFLGVAVLLALLVARSVPPEFPSATNSASSIHAVSSHDQRPRFNCDATKWSLPTRSFQPLRSSGTSSLIRPESPLFSSLQATGIHYKRPPPAV
jgi:hypothetical protein